MGQGERLPVTEIPRASQLSLSVFNRFGKVRAAAASLLKKLHVSPRDAQMILSHAHIRPQRRSTLTSMRKPVTSPWAQQADVVVMMQGADGEARGLCQRANLPRLLRSADRLGCAHVQHAMTCRSVRCKDSVPAGEQIRRVCHPRH